jgi:hypothetical protein
MLILTTVYLQSYDQQKTTECGLGKVKRFFQKAGVEV